MDEQLSAWLQLREPADATARSERLIRAVAGSLPALETIQVLDLATGAGANVRYLAPHLPQRQRWLVVDHDPHLLSLLPDRLSAWAAGRGYAVDAIERECVVRNGHFECRVEARTMNLNSLDAADTFAGRHLITASALLDLVSETWLRTLAARCRHTGAAALFAITYNGRSSCSPGEPEDEMVRGLFNLHQKTDKGLGGAAAGPDASACAVRCFGDLGYRVWTESSDWILGPDHAELQRRLIDGWAAAASELAPEEAGRIRRWRQRRIGHVEAGRSCIVVEHFDIAALPPRD